MRITFKTSFLLFTVLLCIHAAAQKTAAGIKFGNITATDFELQKYPIDSNAQAVILYDGGSAEYSSNNGPWFNVVYTYTKRVRLLSKNAFDLATVEIPLYEREGKDDKLEKPEAATYNISNGIVTKTVLDKASLYTDKGDKQTIKKFTLPDLREGCIIEYRYTIISPAAYTLRGWTFQDRYPVLRSEYEVTIPTLFEFVFLNTGYYDLTPVSKEEGIKNYDIVYHNNATDGKTESYTYKATTVHPRWVLNNLPAIVKEPYISTLKNHVARIEFQLKSLNMPGREPKPFLGTWEQLADELLRDKQFGADLSEKNNWLDDDVKAAVVTNDPVATAKSIFNFVKDHYVCTGNDGIYMPETLKKVYRDKKGNVAEINLLLIAMLRKANIAADPVLLSTVDHGHAFEAYPLINNFNYVIAKADIAGKQYLMDASQNMNGFDHLPAYCYNGSGRMIKEMPVLIPLSPDSISDTKSTLIVIRNEEGGKISGSFNSVLGSFESASMRERINADGKEAFFRKIKNRFNFETVLTEKAIDSLTNYEAPLTVRYFFDVKMNEPVIYFNPLLSEGIKSNPFKAAARNYPVEMPYKTDETIVLVMDIPEGYKIDELPKSQKISLAGTDAAFEYLIQADDLIVQVRCRLTMNRTLYAPEDYELLRSFFEKVVKKESEQVIFRKK